CIDFLAQRIDIAQTQAALRQSEQTIVALEESGLRALLFEAENQLEEIRFTVPDAQQPAAAAAVIRRVLDGLCRPCDKRRRRARRRVPLSIPPSAPSTPRRCARAYRP